MEQRWAWADSTVSQQGPSIPLPLLNSPFHHSRYCPHPPLPYYPRRSSLSLPYPLLYHSDTCLILSHFCLGNAPGIWRSALNPEVTRQLADTPTTALPNHGLVNSRSRQLADEANRSICCFNCMIRLRGHNTTNRITSAIYVEVHMQENINKWPKNENQARKVASGIHKLSSP